MKDRQSLILEYLPLAKGIGYNTCYIPNLNEDCQSVAVEALINAIDDYDASKGASLKSWIALQVKFRVIDFLRSELYHSDSDLFLCDDELENSSQLSSNGMVDQITARNLLHKIFYYIERNRKGKSQTGRKEALLAYFFDGQLMREIAEYRGCSESNVSLIIKSLKLEIKKEFGDCIN